MNMKMKKKLFGNFFQLLCAISLICTTSVYAENTADSTPTSGLNSFAFDFYKQLSTHQQNLIVSPYSLSSVLAILATGAAGDTRSQLLNVLHLPADQNNLLPPLDLQQNPQLIIANALWAQDGLTYKDTFLQQIKTINNLDFFRLNFADAMAATQKINTWVVEKTNGKIVNLIPAGALNSMTRLVLTNAIYFKGDWENQFPITATQRMPFALSNREKINVAMMHQQHSFSYGENDAMQMLQLPYKDNDLAMLVLLPKPQHSLQEAQFMLNGNFKTLVDQMFFTNIAVYLPKFKISSTLDNLAATLLSMGAVNAFTDRADFSNLAREPIYISAIIQKAMITVDEKGTTAAAATAVIMRATAIMKPEQPKLFRANHPFLFLIYDTKTKVILFMGQVSNPNEE